MASPAGITAPGRADASAWSPLCLRTALAFGGAVFRGCALRFAPCARHFSRFAAFDCAPLSPVSPAHSPLAARGYGPAYFRAAPSKLPGPSRPLASLTAARCSGAADALWACPRASSRFATFDCALRFASCARHSSPSGLRTLASSLVALSASLGLLRSVSATGGGLRAPPPYTPPGTIKARKGFGSLALSLGFFDSLKGLRATENAGCLSSLNGLWA